MNCGSLESSGAGSSGLVHGPCLLGDKGTRKRTGAYPLRWRFYSSPRGSRTAKAHATKACRGYHSILSTLYSLFPMVGQRTRMKSTETSMDNDVLRIAGKEFRSRLIVGTGKYKSFQEMARAHEASGAEIVTVAVRRVNLSDRTKESLLDYIDRTKYFILPNTAGCYTADEAVRAARLAREVG